MGAGAETWMNLQASYDLKVGGKENNGPLSNSVNLIKMSRKMS
jgi:plasmid maintenance system antidote protein VapI